MSLNSDHRSAFAGLEDGDEMEQLSAFYRCEFCKKADTVVDGDIPA